MFYVSLGTKSLTADYEYSCSNTVNLLLLIPMQSSKKVKTFCKFFIAVFESTLKIKNFQKKLLTPKNVGT